MGLVVLKTYGWAPQRCWSRDLRPSRLCAAQCTSFHWMTPSPCLQHKLDWIYCKPRRGEDSSRFCRTMKPKTAIVDTSCANLFVQTCCKSQFAKFLFPVLLSTLMGPFLWATCVNSFRSKLPDAMKFGHLKLQHPTKDRLDSHQVAIPSWRCRMMETPWRPRRLR